MVVQIALLLALTLSTAWVPVQPRLHITLVAADDGPPYIAATASSPEQAGPPPVSCSVDWSRAAFAQAGIAVEFVTVPFARCLLLPVSAQVAGCFNAAMTDDNRADSHWRPYSMRNWPSSAG